MTTETEKEEAVARIVREALSERFESEFEFEPVEVVQKTDQDGEPYLHICIVFDGDQDNLDPTWTSGLIGRIRPQLLKLGVANLPSKSFVEKSEWLASRR